MELLLDGTETNPEIIALVESFGYTATKRAEGRALLLAAQTQLGLTQLSRATQKLSTEAFLETEKVGRRAHADLAALDKWGAAYLKFARIALRERPQLLEKLDVKA